MICMPPPPQEERVGKFVVSTIQTCSGRWETCVFEDGEMLSEDIEMTWDDPDKQHRMVVARVRERL